MKNIILISLLLLGVNLQTFAQTFAIGSTAIDFFDANRGRTINTEIRYPADIAGSNVAVAEGDFPVIIFGHGFQITYNRYDYLWENLVSKGYIMAFPTTAGELFPDHEAFGADLSFLVDAMQAESVNNSSLFFNHVSEKTAVMGHSMGGGCAFLAAEANPNITTIITLAAAETNTSAINAASNVSIPNLVVGGSKDCVTPAEDHFLQMYDNSPATCKAYYELIDGTHCQFTNGNATLCYLGEGFVCIGTGPFIDISTQHNLTFAAINPWLAYWLKDDCEAWLDLQDYWANPDGFTISSPDQSCGTGTCPVNMLLNAFLQGPYNSSTGLMNNSLLNTNQLPTTQPYNTAPWNYTGTESVNGVAAFPPNTVDWVLVEALDASNTVVDASAGLLLSDGILVNANNFEPGLPFFNLTEGNTYHFRINHRNHISVVTAATTAIPNLSPIDFANVATVNTGDTQVIAVGSGIFAMISGDGNADKVINYTDYNDCFNAQTNVLPYNSTDYNLDGTVDVTDFNLLQGNMSSIGIIEVR